MHSSAHRGFTLIEILVTSAIIGLLAAVVLSSLSLARARARDSTRLSDLRQLQTALETYKTENGRYPTTGGAWWGVCRTVGNKGTSGPTGWIPDLAPRFIAILPSDPKPSGSTSCYQYRSDSADYHLLAYLSVETLKLTANPAPRPPNNQNEASFSFYTPAARNW